MSLTPVTPMEPVKKNQIPTGDDWVYQVKWDGIRILSYISSGKMILRTRNNNIRTSHYPEITTNLEKQLEVSSCILDGEIITINNNGLPDFYQVLKRDKHKTPSTHLMSNIPITYMIFDILYLNGTWLCQHPLSKRYDMQREIIAPNSTVKLVSNFIKGDNLVTTIKKQQLEGVVAKQLSGYYHLGNSHPTWQKIKNFKYIDAVIGGVILTENQNRIKTLLLGLFHGDNLYYIGRANTGLSNEELKQLKDTLPKLETSLTQFWNLPKISGKLHIKLLSPSLVVRIKYLGWTPDSTLRSPVITGFVTKDPQICRYPYQP